MIVERWTSGTRVSICDTRIVAAFEASRGEFGWRAGSRREVSRLTLSTRQVLRYYGSIVALRRIASNAEHLKRVVLGWLHGTLPLASAQINCRWRGDWQEINSSFSQSSTYNGMRTGRSSSSNRSRRLRPQPRSGRLLRSSRTVRTSVLSSASEKKRLFGSRARIQRPTT
jgi:hypothetical protein